MVEIPDDVAREIAAEIRDYGAPSETNKRWADALDPPKPPPTLAERMVEASRRSGFGDSAEDGMVRALAVVRAAVEGHTDWPDRWAGVSSIEREAYRDGRADAIREALELLGGGSDA